VTRYRAPWYVVNEQGLVRVKVVSVAGTEVFPGIIGADPDAAKPHFEKYGWCDEEGRPDPLEPSYINPKITLDDGTIIWGYECWWTPVLTEIGKERQAALQELHTRQRVETEAFYAFWEQKAMEERFR
jgi:hypothetical protein